MVLKEIELDRDTPNAHCVKCGKVSDSTGTGFFEVCYSMGWFREEVKLIEQYGVPYDQAVFCSDCMPDVLLAWTARKHVLKEEGHAWALSPN